MNCDVELLRMMGLHWQKQYLSIFVKISKHPIYLLLIIHGKANKSYGIDVAKLAGDPSSILQRAEIYLQDLENTLSDKEQK